MLMGPLRIEEHWPAAVTKGEHPDVASGSIHLATLLLELCRPGDAQRLLQRAMEIQERAVGSTSPDLAKTWRHLAQARWIASDDAGAESSSQRALSLLAGHEKERSDTLMDVLTHLATMYDSRKLPREARATWERAVDVGE